MQERDWLHVPDYYSVIDTVLHKIREGTVYNIGENNEKTNIEIVNLIIGTIGRLEGLIKYVKDCPFYE